MSVTMSLPRREAGHTIRSNLTRGNTALAVLLSATTHSVTLPDHHQGVVAQTAMVRV